MRRAFITPRTEILVGSSLAFAHAVFFGIGLYRFDPQLFAKPAVDLSFHPIIFYMLDYPAVLTVQLLLQPLGLFYTYPDFWSYTLTDMSIYAVGTGYWFIIGYSLAKLGPAISLKPQLLKSPKLLFLLVLVLLALISDRPLLFGILGLLGLLVVLAAIISAVIQLVRKYRKAAS